MTMKYLKYEPELEDALGNPLSIPDPDRETMKAYRTTVKQVRTTAIVEAQALGKNIEEIPIDIPEMPTVDADLSQAICYFVNNIPWNRDKDNRPTEPATAEEIDHAISVARAFRAPQNGYIALPEESLKWLESELKENGSRAFTGTVSGVLRERLTGTWLFESKPPELDRQEAKDERLVAGETAKGKAKVSAR